MTSQQRRAMVSLIALSIALAGCGGGGGSSVPRDDIGAVVPPAPPPPPPPTPPPAPPPPPPVTAVAFSPFNLSASQVFPVLGYSYDHTYNERGSLLAGAAEPSSDDRLVLRYNAATRGYESELPGFAPGRLVINATTTGRGYDVTAGLASNSRQPASLHFGSEDVADGVQLQHSNMVQLFARPPGTNGTTRQGFFAFGVPALAGGIPVAGTRDYVGLTQGFTSVFERPAAGSGHFDQYYLFGAGSVQLDFGAGAISGSLYLEIYDFGREDAFGRFTLNGALGAGATTFQGTVNSPGGGGERGTFEGRITGPDASELIVRWRVPATDPESGRPLVAFGAFAARMH